MVNPAKEEQHQQDQSTMGDKKVPVKLHATWGSPNSHRVEMALKLKGVEYDLIEEDLQNKSPELVGYNPVHKKIPVLVHGTKAIAESQVILEYIDETWDSGTPILPRDPYARAQARFWARFMDEKLYPSLRKAFILGEDKAMEEARENMKLLDEQLQGKRFFGGETIGFVDIVANSIGYWLAVFEECVGKVVLTEDAFPSVCRWRDEFLSSQVAQQTLPTPKDALVAKFRVIIHAMRTQNFH